MNPRTPILAALIGALCLLAPPAARAEFGLSELKVDFRDSAGQAVTQAGSHPFELKVDQQFISVTGNVEEAAKDLILTLPEGFVGNPTAVPSCATAEFLIAPAGECPDASAVGYATVQLAVSGGGGGTTEAPLYSLQPPPGSAAKFGIWFLGVPVTVEARVSPTPPFNVSTGPTNISQALEVLGTSFTLWGTPADPAHDSERGHCQGPGSDECPANIAEVPFLTLPRSCSGPLETKYATDSWEHPGARLPDGFPDLSDPNWVTGSALSADPEGHPVGLSGCGKLGFGPEIAVAPTTTSAQSASGLDLNIDVADEGLANPDGVAQADIAATEFRLPAGVTVNPSAAEGLGVCTPAQFESASLAVRGCPDASKLGSLEVKTPILEERTLRGAFYLAAPNENPFDSLLAAYLVIRDEELGVFVKLAAKIDTDPKTGQIVTTVKEMPPFPLEAVRVHLRSGARAPLITPPACGTYTTTALLYPSTGAPPLQAASDFQITSGPGAGPCPAAGTLPFAPGFEAGSANSAASRYSPFAMRLTRQDGQQDLTKFSAVLPPGVSGKIAGIAKCPDAAIEAAKVKTGHAEQASPSCPASSLVGHVLAGAGVGSALTYVPGSLYLAGPYKGAPLSVAAIVPAVAGPFDVGTVVTRVGLNLNPSSAQVEVDGAASDPIPHILEGIPLALRDLRVLTDRPDFTLNPTSCTPFQTVAQIFGSGADPFNGADDAPVSRQARYQASSCASLGFKPKLSIVLKGGTKRNDHPALRSSVTYPYPSGPGYANIAKAVITLPHSEFIDPEHINNPCTRVQFNANACPPTSVLGTAKAITPLLDEPLEGPVYFRSNGGDRKVPDIVADLHGLIDIVVVGFVDSKHARIRTTFQNVPDAPVTSFALNLYGGKKKGVIVNSANLCAHKRHIKIALSGQNGRTFNSEPALVADCKKAKAAKGSAHRR